jgi:peptidoglycan/LPS O-acetylase OafA/YrhL
MGVAGFVTALVASLLLFPPAFMSVFSGEFDFLGNGTWQSAVYALWDSCFAVGMILAAITLFRRFLNGESRFGRFLSRQSYAVYIIHSPIIVVLAYSLYRAYVLGGIDPGPLLKFGIAAIIVLPTSFAVAYVIRKIPGVSRVL